MGNVFVCLDLVFSGHNLHSVDCAPRTEWYPFTNFSCASMHGILSSVQHEAYTTNVNDMVMQEHTNADTHKHTHQFLLDADSSLSLDKELFFVTLCHPKITGPFSSIFNEFTTRAVFFQMSLYHSCRTVRGSDGVKSSEHIGK
jgi:hypothetical protein